MTAFRLRPRRSALVRKTSDTRPVSRLFLVSAAYALVLGLSAVFLFVLFRSVNEPRDRAQLLENAIPVLNRAGLAEVVLRVRRAVPPAPVPAPTAPSPIAPS